MKIGKSGIMRGEEKEGERGVEGRGECGETRDVKG